VRKDILVQRLSHWLKGMTMKWSNARTAIVSCCVAAVTALGVAAVPALAGSRAPSATATPVILSGTRTSAEINGQTTIARLGLPKGSWVVFAKADVSTAGGGPVQLHCTLKAGSSSDHTDPELESGTGAFDENIALNVAHKFANAGAALLSCNSSGVVVDVVSVKMTGIKAGKLSIVSLQLV
jgi:hypothetical protein